jgi:hypothetical protein
VHLLQSALDDLQGQRALIPRIDRQNGAGIDIATIKVELRDLLAQRFDAGCADGFAQERGRYSLQVFTADDGVANKANAVKRHALTF